VARSKITTMSDVTEAELELIRMLMTRMEAIELRLAAIENYILAEQVA
jgi:hypothetical protein